METRNRLVAIVEECKTQREASARLGVSEQYVSILARQLGISKWRQKNRKYKELKEERKICSECGEAFTKLANNNPARFCSKKCQGRWLGKNYGFGSRKNLGGGGGEKPT